MLFIIWGLLILLGMIFPKSKMVTVMMVGFMIITICFRTQGADYIIYQNEFKWSEIQAFSDVHYVGFLILEQWAHNVGMEFEQFIIFVGSISCFLLYFGIRGLTSNINMVLALFLIYPFSHEAIQTRTFLANSIIISALPLVLKEEPKAGNRQAILVKKKIPRLILFYVMAILACSFHFEVAIYVFFITLMLFLPDKYGKEYVLVGTGLAFLLIETGVLPKVVSRFNSRIAYWLSGKTGLGIIIPIFITLVIWYAIQLAGKCCVAKSIEDEQESLLYKNMLRLSDFLFLLIPLFCYDITFNRLWRLFLIALYIMVARVFPYKMNKNTRLWIVFLLVVMFVSVCVYERVFPLLMGFFENNGVFGSMSLFN